MGGCLSKRSSPQPVQEPVSNVLREKHVLLVDIPSNRQNPPSSGTVKAVKQENTSSHVQLNSEPDVKPPSPASTSSMEPLCSTEPSSTVHVVAASPSPEQVCVEENPPEVATIDSVHVEPVNQVSVDQEVIHEVEVPAPVAEPSSVPVVPVQTEEAVVIPATSEVEAPVVPVPVEGETPATGGEVSEEPAVKYSEIDRIASFNLGHSHANTTSRESEHDIDRLKHFQKLGSATLVQGRHGPLMTGRGGKNRRSSTQHFPTETPITVSPRSAEI